MEKKRAPKKVTLARETVRLLTAQQAKEVQGAVTFNTYYCTGDSVHACCAE
ncbi:MAG TPA: hypothetical protein VN851_25275 [Thermoanaerobaculia bacterium]|nr:hypothetical protein [Thermoanaerobaculia bacterium]